MPYSYDGRYALANPGGEVTVYSINNDINVFGVQTKIKTTYSASFPDIQDAPVQLERPKLDQQWWDNLLTGVLLTVTLAACAALTICTCGMGLGAAALIGAAVGAALVTTAVSVADAKTGHGRSADEFAKELLLGAGVGALAGACIYWMGPAIASQVAGKIGGLTMMGNGVVGSLAATFNAPWLIGAMTYVPTVAKVTVYTIVGVNAARKGNDVLTWITGENLILDTVFGGNEGAYQTASDIFDVADEFLDQIPEVDMNTPSTTNSSSQADADTEPYEPPQPMNEAAQRYVDRSVNAQMDAADQAAGAQMNVVDTSVNAQMDVVDTGTGAMTRQLDGPDGPSGGTTGVVGDVDGPSSGTGGAIGTVGDVDGPSSGTGGTTGTAGDVDGPSGGTGGSGNSGVVISNNPEGGLSSLSKPSSKVLRENMVRAGIEVPDYPNAAHHIVAGSSPKASEARAILQRFGVDINDATNGVFLPTQRGVSNSAYHPSLHTDSYYRKVTELLRSATSREDVLDILDNIAEELLDGSF